MPIEIAGTHGLSNMVWMPCSGQLNAVKTGSSEQRTSGQIVFLLINGSDVYAGITLLGVFRQLTMVQAGFMSTTALHGHSFIRWPLWELHFCCSGCGCLPSSDNGNHWTMQIQVTQCGLCNETKDKFVAGVPIWRYRTSAEVLTGLLAIRDNKE